MGVACLVFVGMAYNKYVIQDDIFVTTEDVMKQARRSSVQTVFHIPVIRASFTAPLPEEEEFTKEIVEDMLKEREEKIKEDIEEAKKALKEELNEERYESSLTKLEKWGYEPPSATFIPLGALIDEDVKFPDRILVTCKIEEEEIDPYKKEYAEDVLTISTTADVSPDTAKHILINLRSKGYSISKDEIKKSENVQLLYFSPDWSDSYPTRLNWKVALEGEEETNLIVGYDCRGIFETKPIPEGRKVHVIAGYHELKDKFKEKSHEIKKLEQKIESLEEDKEELQEALEEMIEEKKEEEEKRDISQATYMDVRYGRVQLEYLQFISSASGTFLGNTKAREDFYGLGSLRGWGWYRHDLELEKMGVILTNAHVVDMARAFEMYISADKEVMLIVLPGKPFIRYTKDSDFFGSPASTLAIDDETVISWDFDCGIMITSPVPQYEKFKASLGDSDLVEEGDNVLMVGNPAGMQKYTTEGVVSQTNFSMLDRLDSDYFLQYLNKLSYNYIKNSSFWFDTPIGTGGTSGSAVWSLDGPNKGKIIAIHNMGLVTRHTFFGAVDDCSDDVGYLLSGSDKRIADSEVKDFAKLLDKRFDKSVSYSTRYDDFIEKFPTFKDFFEEKCGGYQELSGMNGGVPINKIKQYLQERGLNPDEFDWEGLKDEYFEK